MHLNYTRPGELQPKGQSGNAVCQAAGNWKTADVVNTSICQLDIAEKTTTLMAKRVQLTHFSIQKSGLIVIPLVSERDNSNGSTTKTASRQ
jgi:hypothetical protein